MLHIPVKNVEVKKGKWLAWEKPGDGILKLNTDGSVKDNAATGGGVVPDSRGEFVLGYALKLTHQDVLQAELEAIIQSLVVCRDRGLKPEVEIDSAMAYNMITRRKIGCLEV